MAKNWSAAKVYIEVAFWLNLVAAATGVIIQTVTGYPGTVIDPSFLLIGNVLIAVFNLVAGMLLNRAKQPTP